MAFLAMGAVILRISLLINPKVIIPLVSVISDNGLFQISIPDRRVGVYEFTNLVPGNGSPCKFPSLASPSASIISTPIAFGSLFGSLLFQLEAL